MTTMVGSIAAGGRDVAAAAESSHLIHEREAERELSEEDAGF